MVSQTAGLVRRPVSYLAVSWLRRSPDLVQDYKTGPVAYETRGKVSYLTLFTLHTIFAKLSIPHETQMGPPVS